MAVSSPKSYTFNHPLAGLLLLPLILLAVMLVAGLLREFNIVALIVLIFNSVLVAVIVGYGFLRRIRFEGDKVIWKTLRGQKIMEGSEIRRYGIVKYRAFRFIYLSKQSESPFDPERPNVSPTSETFVFQYRKSAWKTVEGWLKGKSEAAREDMVFRN